MHGHLNVLAQKYPMVKQRAISAEQIGFDSQVLPALLFYRDGGLVNSFMLVYDDCDGRSVEHLEQFLNR